MKLKAVAFTLGLCAAGMLVLPDGALARGGGHRGGFHGGRAWHGGGGHWAGGGRHWAGGRGWHGGRYYAGGRRWGAAAAGAAVGAAAVGAAAYGSSCYQLQNVWNGYAYVQQYVRVC
jgi:hypothetical protein